MHGGTVRGGGAAWLPHGGVLTSARETAGENVARLTGAWTVARHDGVDGGIGWHDDVDVGDTVRTGQRRLRTAVVGTWRGWDSGVRGEARGCRAADGGRDAAREARRGEARQRRSDAARSGAHLIPRARVWTAPPTAANPGSARHDTAADRRAPRVSQFPE
jgi:hypothetical protein